MRPDPAVLTQDEPVSRAAEIMRDLGVSLVPVVDDPSSMCLIGVITDHDIAVRCVASDHGGSCIVAEHMTADHLRTVRTGADVGDVIALMERHEVRCVPVISDDNRLAGTITRADLPAELTAAAPSSNRLPK
jgi:CBS domain-containing protein